MTRITTTILIVLLLLNGTVTVMEGSGLSEDLGVNLAPGISEDMTNATESFKQGFQTEDSGETLFNLFKSGLGIFSVIASGVLAAPAMFLNLGFPEWIVLPLFAPMYLVAAAELTYAATGRDLL